MDIIKFIITWIKFHLSKEPHKILKYQCKHLYNDGKWSIDHKYGAACLKRSDHFGQHRAYVGTDILDEVNDERRS